MGLGLSGAFGAVGAMQGLRAIQDRAIEEQQRAAKVEQQKFQNEIALREIANNEKLADIRLIPKPEATTDYGDFLKRYAGGKPITADIEVAARKAWTEAGAPPQKPESKSEFEAFAAASPEEQARLIALRKQWGVADDRAPRIPPYYQWATDPSTGQARLMTADEIRQLGATQAPTADMRARDRIIGMAGRSVNAVKDLSSKVITLNGVAQRAKAAGQSVEAALGNNPTYRTYQDARVALAGNLAVLQQGSRPSDADIRSVWLPLVPDAFNDTEESAKMKWDLIDIMSGFNQPSKAQGNKTAPTLQSGEKLAADGVTVLVKNARGQWVPK